MKKIFVVLFAFLAMSATLGFSGHNDVVVIKKVK